MYGEKAEQCEELKMDLEDVKSMYKSQVKRSLLSYARNLPRHPSDSGLGNGLDSLESSIPLFIGH